ncbi:MAG: arginine--tRNA ligase [Thermoplasmatota archaeon]|nr:arginine--tRNA ligase [Halobacteriales archaeon]
MPPAPPAPAHPMAAFRAEAVALAAAAAATLGHSGGLPDPEVPPDPAMGELGIPCFALAKVLRRGPPAIAAELAKAVPAAGRTWVAEVRAAGPYLNFSVDRRKLGAAVLADPDRALRAAPVAGKVLFEHTSANPNGPLHVGRARNPIVGDTLARILRAAGHDVEVQYYMDNLGRQVATLAWGKWNIDSATLPPAGRAKTDHDLVRYYQAAHELAKTDPAVGAKVRDVVERLESADPQLLPKVREVYEACFAGMQDSLHRLGVHHDTVKDESDVVEDGSVAKVVAALKGLPSAAQEADGANYLDLSAQLKGQKDKFYFTRKDGSSVYATRDIAYHAWKAQQVGSAGRLVDVLGEDHRLQALQVGVALEALGVARPTVVFYSFVSLPQAGGKGSGKMSTRANRVVFVDDLLDEGARLAYDEVAKRRGAELGEAEMRRIAEAVGVAAVRFNIARIQPEKPIEFRWEEALSFDGDSAPYLMYAHARAASLLRKAAEAGLEVGPVAAGDLGDGELRLLLAVARFQDAAQEAARQLAPHRMAGYALELAGAFNEYYRDHRVLEADPVQQKARLAAMAAGHKALRRTLDTLGIPALDSM